MPRLRRRPRWGDLRRTEPFGRQFGYERGTPIDRVYIEEFLGGHAADVRGEVLEIGEPLYTERFGGQDVTASHVLDLDAANPRATIVGDLAAPDTLPAARFDCAILTQTLQFVTDVDAALANVWRALAPGGVLLVAVPTISKLDTDYERDLWRFTAAGLEELLTRTCRGGELEVGGYGNVLAAVAFLMGLAAEDLRPAELEVRDPELALVACGRARKSPR
jgi:SAM-dependent methyltransferase